MNCSTRLDQKEQRLEPPERLLLHLQLGFDVAACCARALVAEAKRNRVEQNAAVQQVHGCRMPQGVRRDTLGLQARLNGRGLSRRQRQALCHVASRIAVAAPANAGDRRTAAYS
jgi:hypothetical protein